MQQWGLGEAPDSYLSEGGTEAICTRAGHVAGTEGVKEGSEDLALSSWKGGCRLLRWG